MRKVDAERVIHSYLAAAGGVEGVRLYVLEEPPAELVDLGILPDQAGACLSIDGEARCYVFAGNCGTEADVEMVLLHELAHAIGYDEDDVQSMGLAL